jgi:hypothetical protein
MRSAFVVFLAFTSAAVLGAQQFDSKSPPTLPQVLSRAAQYAVSYGEALSTVLAEETYAQTLVWSDRRGNAQAPVNRRLQAEIAFVRLADTTEWLAFRNVTSVDGRPIEDSRDLLERLFRDPQGGVLAQARVIARESARYNLGPITREINVPTIALLFIHPTHQPNSRFTRAGEEMVDGVSAWIVRFEERDHGGLISRSDGRSVQAKGRLWIVPGDGRIVRSELTLENFIGRGSKSRADVTVKWRDDPAMQMWVPSDMHEHYDGDTPKNVRFDISGVATYSNYRRFSTSVKIK